MSISEYKNFARLLIGSGEHSADIRYAAKISTPDDFIYFEAGDMKAAVLSDLEIDRARTSGGNAVALFNETDFGSSKVEILTAICKQFRLCGFTVPADFPLGTAEKLRAAGIEVAVSEKPFFPEREFKSPDEVGLIIEAQCAGEAAFARAVEILKECDSDSQKRLIWNDSPLTSEILRAEMDCIMLKRGMLPTGTICAGGPQSAQPHNCGSGILYADRPIVMDIFPRSAASGYWGDLTRTVVRGKASDIVKRAYEAVLEARERAKSLICAGAVCADLHRAARAVLDKHRFFTGVNDGSPFGFFHGLGHGVGLEIHENPRLSPRSEGILRGGEVVTVEPGLYYPEWGGIRLEDLVYLSDDGAVCLTEAPDFLIVE